jgi:hypothetical protein
LVRFRYNKNYCSYIFTRKGAVMTDKQPEALRLADYFDRFERSSHQTEDGEPLHIAAAAELRRLHEVNAQLVEMLRWLNLRGGLGLDVHDALRKLIAKATGEQQ